MSDVFAERSFKAPVSNIFTDGSFSAPGAKHQKHETKQKGNHQSVSTQRSYCKFPKNSH